MSVAALQRIEGPGHDSNFQVLITRTANSYGPHTIALSEFELVAQVRVAILLMHSQCVRMHREMSLLCPKKSKCKPHEFIAIESAHPNAAGFFGGDNHGEW